MIKQSDLGDLRKKLKLNQSDLSALLHCTTRMYQYYESMQKDMPLSLLELLDFKLKERRALNDNQ